jgi:thiol:disulfide interchange protein DsbD
MIRFVLFAALLFLQSSLGTASAQEEPRIPVRVVASPRAIPAGGEGFLDIALDIPSGTHIQINDFLFARVEAPEGVSLGALSLPAAQEYEGDPVYKGRLALRVPFSLPSDASPGELTLKVRVGYQACTETPVFICFPPNETVVDVPLRVLPAGGGPAAAGFLPEGSAGGNIPEGDSLANRVERALARGSLVAFLLVFLGGIAMSFTPCVYPMIPITISYIGGRSRGKLGGFVLSIFFVLGIAITYAILGVFAAQTGALFGSAMQSPLVLLLVALVLLGMGASMFGAFDIVLPASVQTGMQKRVPRGGFVGAVLMGAVTGLVASPCVGPVLIVLLTWVAKVGNVFLGFWLLFTFAWGLGMLFLVLGTFAGAINALPRAGEWMAVVKHVFGVILVVMGFYYLKPVIGETAFWLLLGAFAIFVAAFTGAFHRLPEAPSWMMQFRKGLGIVILVLGVFFLGRGLLPTMPLPALRAPMMTTGAPGPTMEAGLPWMDSDEEAIARALPGRGGRSSSTSTRTGAPPAGSWTRRPGATRKWRASWSGSSS